MLKLWGRTNSINVKKVLWMLDEIGQAYDRVDAGMEHGRVNDADYRAMNPNGRVPRSEEQRLNSSHEFVSRMPSSA